MLETCGKKLFDVASLSDKDGPETIGQNIDCGLEQFLGNFRPLPHQGSSIPANIFAKYNLECHLSNAENRMKIDLTFDKLQFCEWEAIQQFCRKPAEFHLFVH